ncbi:MAG: ABC transporter ATP-binding protein, partial [Pseudomonadota bacterium]
MKPQTPPAPITIAQLLHFCFKILGPEKDFYILATVYGIGISLLSLATPISVQMLINTVANTALATPLIVLSATLFGLLLISGLLNALRVHLMEIFGRRFYARLVSEITLRSVYAQNPFFSDEGRGALFNRYFDILTVQKNIPVMLIGGFTLLLQAGVGFALVSFYHPLFLAFNTVFIILIWLVWLIWGRSAIRSAVELSHRKHNTAAWLEGLAASNGFFKSERHIAHALKRTDAATADYVTAHRKHFRRHFAQTVSFFVIYAAASAILLGMGGWLVIQGELSLGQLVAAELVLSAAFFGVSQLGWYLGYFYDLCASIEELSLFYSVEQEEPSGAFRPQTANASLAFANVRGDARGAEAVLNFNIESGETVMATAENHGLQRLMTNLIKRHLEPESGFLAFGGGDVRDTDTHALRQDIIVLDRPTIIEMTMRDYLTLSARDPNPQEILHAIKAVGLEPVIAGLEDGLDTHLATTGWPLSISETMQLKLAGALLAHPRLLVLTQLFDLVAET